jgi:chromosome segregation ATPase
MSVQTLEDMRESLGQPKDAPVAPTENESRIARLISDDSAKREAERLRKRKELRDRIREREALVLQMADLTEQLKLLDAKADALAADHASQTQPIQEALAAATGPKRSALLGKLTTANIELEQAIAVVNRCRVPLTRQHRDLRNEIAGLPVEGALAGLGSPATLAEMFSARIRFQHATSRLEAAQDQLSFLEQQLDEARRTKYPVSEFGWEKPGKAPQVNFELIASLDRRVREWKCELVHALQEQHAATAEIDSLTADLIAE